MSTLIHETNSNNEACNLVAARNKIIQTAYRQYKSWAYTHRVRISSQQTLRATPECFASYFGRNIVALHFATVASCSKLLENENLFAGYFQLTGKRVRVYFEETSICLLKKLT